jgi:hypothetical protein
MSERWSAALGVAREKTADGWRLPIDGGEIRFVKAADGRGEGLAAFDVAVRDPADVQARAKARGCTDSAGNVVLCGTRIKLLQA